MLGSSTRGPLRMHIRNRTLKIFGVA